MRHRFTPWSACLCGLLCLGLPAHAQSIAAAPASQPWLTVDDATLAHMRGGFALADGLLVTLGITRALYINGALVTESQLHLNTMATLNTAQATQLGQQLQALNLVQIGPGNLFQAGNAALTQSVQGTTSAMVSSVTGLGPGTIIQNSLNGQNILLRTTIDASSTGLSMLRATQLQSDISQAVQQAIGTR